MAVPGSGSAFVQQPPEVPAILQTGAMGLGLLLGSLLGVFLCMFVFLIVSVVYFEFANSDIPPGLANPVRLRFIHGIMIFVAMLGRILEKFGVGNQVEFNRYVRERLLLKTVVPWDPQLYIKDTLFDGVPVRVYQPNGLSTGSWKGVMFFHGGGWMFGSLDSYDRLCRYIARESMCVVVSVGYRRSPEHRYPAQYEDCFNATVHFMKVREHYGVNASRIIISGESAGGTLAAAVCQGLLSRKDLPQPLAQILIYPLVQMVDFNLPSYQQNRAVPILYRERVVFYVLQYLNGDMSGIVEVLQGQHVSGAMKTKFKKWISADNIPDRFKTRGYDPPEAVVPNEQVCEKVKDVIKMACSPLLSDDEVFRGLPKAYILTCEYDVLRDDGLLYKKRLEDAGVPVTWYHVPDSFHGVVSFFDQYIPIPAGKLAVEDIVNFIKSA